jgi:hypothetical protein
MERWQLVLETVACDLCGSDDAEPVMRAEETPYTPAPGHRDDPAGGSAQLIEAQPRAQRRGRAVTLAELDEAHVEDVEDVAAGGPRSRPRRGPSRSTSGCLHVR